MICPPKKDGAGVPKGGVPAVTIDEPDDKSPSTPVAVTAAPITAEHPLVGIDVKVRASVAKAPVGSRVVWTMTVTNRGAAVFDGRPSEPASTHLTPVTRGLQGAKVSMGVLSMQIGRIKHGQSRVGEDTDDGRLRAEVTATSLTEWRCHGSHPCETRSCLHNGHGVRRGRVEKHRRGLREGRPVSLPA